MAITVTRADYPRTVYRTLVILGIQDPDYITPRVLTGAPWTLANIQEAVMQADLQIALRICNLAAHPYKNFFFTETPVDLVNGSKIPPAIGEHYYVEIELDPLVIEAPGPNLPGPKKKGRLAKNYQHVQDALDYPNIFGTADYLYWIEHGQIFFKGAKARIYSPTIELNRATIASSGLLNCPDAYANGIIATAPQMLLQRGGDSSLVEHYEREGEKFHDRMIMKKALDLPEVEQFQKAE